jgi:hypothetical protein
LSSVDIKDISVTSGLAIESEGAVSVSNLKLAGTKNNLRKGLLKMKGGAVVITDSSIENISIDPLSEEVVLESSGSQFKVQNLSMANIMNTKVRAESISESA